MQTVSLCLPLGALEILYKQVFLGKFIMISEVVYPLVGLEMYVVKHLVNPFLVTPEHIPVKICVCLLESTSLQDIVHSVVKRTPEFHIFPRRILALCSHILPQEV